MAGFPPVFSDKVSLVKIYSLNSSTHCCSLNLHNFFTSFPLFSCFNFRSTHQLIISFASITTKLKIHSQPFIDHLEILWFISHIWYSSEYWNKVNFFLFFTRNFLKGFFLHTNLKNQRNFLSLLLLKRKRHQLKNLFRYHLLRKLFHLLPRLRWLILVTYWWVK